MLFARPMYRLTWFLPHERLADGLKLLAQTGVFHLSDHRLLGQGRDISELKKAYKLRGLNTRQQKAHRLMQSFPSRTVLRYHMGEMPPEALSRLRIPGLLADESGVFLWAGEGLPPEALTAYLYPDEPVQAPKLPLELDEEQWRLLFSHADRVGHAGSWAVIDGWIPADQYMQISDLLAGEAVCFCTAEHSGLHFEEVPVEHERPAWLDGFGALMRSFGLTGYREVDPTLLLSTGFILMFGMMFADLGQGVVLAGLGLLLIHASTRHKGPNWMRIPEAGMVGRVLLPIGISAAVFGMLFGSCFAREDIIPALWFRPLHDITFYVGASIGIGMATIFLGLILGLVNTIRMGRIGDTLGDKFGPMGLIFYTGLIVLTLAILADINLLFMGLWLCFTALLAVTCFKFRALSGEAVWLRLFLGLLEGYDLALRFIIQTLSFVRIAAFTLAHIGLSMAVVMMATSLESWPLLSFAVLAVGNVFIIVLEGILVSIQVLRLHFFEFFTKFVVADGKAFKPLSLREEAGC